LVVFPRFPCFVGLEQLIIHYTQLTSLNTEHFFDTRIWRHEFSALPSMLMIRLACTIIFCASDYRSVSIFHHPWWYDAKKLFLLCLWSKFTGYFASFDLGFNSYGIQFPCFWIISMAFKRLEIVNRLTFNDSASSFCVWFLIE